MSNLIVNAVMASIVLTALVNVIPRLFPGSSAEDRVRDILGDPPRSADDAVHEPPRFRVWFPWRSMLVGSILVTVVVNVIAFLS